MKPLGTISRAMAGLTVLSLGAAVATAQEPYGSPVNGLQCGAVVVSPSSVEELSVERLQDLTLSIWLKNVAGKQVRVVLDEDGPVQWALPELFDLEIFDSSGKPVTHPAFRYRSGWMLLERVTVRELSEGRVIETRASLADWFGWQGVVLPAGSYWLNVSYVGVPRPDQPWIPSELRSHLEKKLRVFDGTWTGRVTSAAIAFRITGDSSAPSWGKPEKGLRTALELRPRGDAYFVGERVQPIFHVENVGDETIFFDRELPSQQEDEMEVKDADGRRLQYGGMFCTGMSPWIRWVLRPSERVQLFGAPVELRLADERAPSARPQSVVPGFAGAEGSSRTSLTARPGSYSLTFRLLQRKCGIDFEPEPVGAREWNDYLVAGPRTIRLMERK